MTEDDTRFEALFTAHYADVLSYAIRRCGSRAEAEDVVAETFAVAWRRLADLPEGDEARLWLFGTARLVWHNSRRSLRRRQSLFERLRQRSPRTSHASMERDVVARDRLRSALATLHEADREVVRLHAWEGLSADEMAIVLEISTPAVWKRLQRARARLRTALERADDPAPIARLGLAPSSRKDAR